MLAFGTLLGGCTADVFPDTDSGTSSPFTATVDVEGELEVGVELTLTISLFHEGELITDATPEVEFEGPEMGHIEVVPGSTAGSFVGTHTFHAEGEYHLKIHFHAEGADREADVHLLVHGAHEHEH